MDILKKWAKDKIWEWHECHDELSLDYLVDELYQEFFLKGHREAIQTMNTLSTAMNGKAMDELTCPNKSNHTSAFPASDRKLCPECKKVYVKCQ